MTNETNHTPMPWRLWPATLNGRPVEITAKDDDRRDFASSVALFPMDDRQPKGMDTRTAAFVLRACESHAGLVDALKEARGLVLEYQRHSGIKLTAYINKIDDALTSAGVKAGE